MDIVHLLIDSGADVRASTTKGFTPLMLAARNADIDMAKVLITAGVTVNDTGSDGTHVLPYAIVSGNADFAMFLLEQGADPNASMGGVRPLHAAAGSVGTWLDDWTRTHGRGSLSGGGRRGFDTAARLRLVKALLARGADPNARIDTSAMFMSYIGYPKKGAFETYACGTGDLRGATPLWVAAYTANGSGDGFGGDPTRGDNSRFRGYAEIIRTLLDAGADQQLTTTDGTTPLMVAAGLGRFTFEPGLKRGRRSQSAEEALKVLLDAGGRINAVNEADFTALHGAAFRGLDEVIQILVDRGADINARDFRGRTPFRLAEGSKQSFQFQAFPGTAEFIKGLGANTRLGIPGTVQERLRDVPAVSASQQQD
jgi:ankyrin repeat protein